MSQVIEKIEYNIGDFLRLDAIGTKELTIICQVIGIEQSNNKDTFYNPTHILYIMKDSDRVNNWNYKTQNLVIDIWKRDWNITKLTKNEALLECLK